MEITEILKYAVQIGASDVHLKVGLPPLFRINGALAPLKNGPRSSPEGLLALIQSMTTPEQFAQYQSTHELDFASQLPSLGRFRVNVFRQRGNPGMVLRVISNDIRSIDELGLPTVLHKIAEEYRGLVLVTGATGSGKSTTLAALIDKINQTRTAHIVTIEDPIEYVFRDRRSVINQREVGEDTHSFAAALRSALRQDPDVILVGEMRDQVTIETAIGASETGHLVLSTLHTVDAVDTINRIITMFPPHQHPQIRQALSNNLRMIISQRLMKTADERGRVAAMEILLSTARIRELLEEGRTAELRDAIAEGHSNYQMQTFDQHLMALLTRGKITRDTALEHSTNRDDFLLRLAGVQGTSDTTWSAFE